MRPCRCLQWSCKKIENVSKEATITCAGPPGACTFGDDGRHIKDKLAGSSMATRSKLLAIASELVMVDSGGQDAIGVSTFLDPLLVSSLQKLKELLFVNPSNGAFAKVAVFFCDFERLWMLGQVPSDGFSTLRTFCCRKGRNEN